MTNDIEQALASLNKGIVPVSEVRLSERVYALLPLVEMVRDALADPEGQFSVRIAEASPRERADLNKLRAVLDELLVPLTIRRKALDNAVRIAAAQTGADEFVVAGTDKISLSRPDLPYEVEVGQLREALMALIPEGTITQADIDAAIIPFTSYRVDNRALNKLRDHRGEKVAAAIAKHRRKPEVTPARMRVTWPAPVEEP